MCEDVCLWLSALFALSSLWSSALLWCPLKAFHPKNFHMKFVAVTWCTNKQACCTNSSHTYPSHIHSHVGTTQLSLSCTCHSSSLLIFLTFAGGKRLWKVREDIKGQTPLINQTCPIHWWWAGNTRVCLIFFGWQSSWPEVTPVAAMFACKLPLSVGVHSGVNAQAEAGLCTCVNVWVSVGVCWSVCMLELIFYWRILLWGRLKLALFVPSETCVFWLRGTVAITHR